jgi:uncharacterized coiled-coil protein SlyX
MKEKLTPQQQAIDELQRALMQEARCARTQANIIRDTIDHHDEKWRTPERMADLLDRAAERMKARVAAIRQHLIEPTES